jgi:dihydrolipoamide dehydrogenase
MIGKTEVLPGRRIARARRTANMENTFDLAVIGGGPGGYVAAIRGAQLGLKVCLVEREKIGGVCMNWGCIPTKYLLHETNTYMDLISHKNLKGPLAEIRCDWEKIQQERQSIVDRLVKGIEFLLQRNGVSVLRGEAKPENSGFLRIRGRNGEQRLGADKFILATGSRPAELPFLKPDGRRVVTSREALELSRVPRSLLVVGAGAIGLEMGVIYSRMGTEVTILELMPTILPGSDRELVTRLERLLKRQGIEIHTRMRIEEGIPGEKRICLKGNCLKDEKPFAFEAEKVLLAVGRRPNSEIVADLKDISVDKAGFIEVDDCLQTGKRGVYAIGDVIGGKLLAHKASHEGMIAAENAAGADKRISHNALPLAVFTEPEFASVGLTEDEARERGIVFRKGMFSLQASGRALTMGKTDGMVKVLADPKNRIIGAHILAHNAADLLPEMTLACEKGLRLQDVSSTVHIHPTLSECLMEAALNAEGRAVHRINTRD